MIHNTIVKAQVIHDNVDDDNDFDVTNPTQDAGLHPVYTQWALMYY